MRPDTSTTSPTLSDRIWSSEIGARSGISRPVLGNPAATTSGGSIGWVGDVKYHLGARRAYKESGVEQMPITLAPNPSHLEFVNPVVEGRARAAQEQRDRPGVPTQDKRASLATSKDAVLPTNSE